MIQQFFFREFSSVNKRVDRFLKKSNRLRILKKETDDANKKVVYSIGVRWTLLNVTMINKAIRLTLTKIDSSVTQVELNVTRKINGTFASKTAENLLNNLSYIF